MFFSRFCFWMIAVLWWGIIAALSGQGTTITYQGLLSVDGEPADGTFDLRFQLFDSETNGVGVGTPLTLAGQSVADGTFAAPLDFGAGIFMGQALWLQLEVKEPSESTWETLFPRQAVTVTPYAIHASTAESAPIPDGAITSAKLATGAVTSGALQTDAVGTQAIADGSIAGEDLALGSVNSGHLDLLSFKTVFWKVGGNAGLLPGTFRLGTNDNQAFELMTDAQRVFRFEPTASTPNLLGGFTDNAALAGVEGATVGGGGYHDEVMAHPNVITDHFGTIGGGTGNQAGDASGTTSDRPHASVGGGEDNRAEGAHSTVAGGVSNIAHGLSATIGGGRVHNAGGEASTIGGGASNQVGGDYAVIAGGSSNNASGTYTTIAGGYDNLAEGFGATVGGGTSNRATGIATIGGGTNNVADNGTIGGGTENETNFGTIAGGYRNVNLRGGSAIGGGSLNLIDAESSAIGGGSRNEIYGWYSVIGGGASNLIEHIGSLTGIGAGTIGGGDHNTVDGDFATIGGGYINSVTAHLGTIGGGGPSDLGDFANTNNRVTDNWGTIGGGGGNRAGDNDGDLSDAPFATVGGGADNHAEGRGSTISGGEGNTATGFRATVGGGVSNEAAGSYAVVPGGGHNEASGQYSFAGGRRAKATYPGCFLWADNNNADLSATGDNEFKIRAAGGVYFYTQWPVLAGAVLFPGSGTWTNASSVQLKTDFQAIDPLEILTRVASLDIRKWRYKAQAEGIAHLGPTAEEFRAAFGLGATPEGIAAVDADGVALAAIQGMNVKLERELAAKEAQIETMAERLEALESLVSQLARRRNAP